MQRKISVGIELSPAVKKRLMQKIDKWKDLPIRWSAENNLHLVLVSIGYVDDELLPGICESVRMAVENIKSFDIDLSKIELGPKGEKDAKLVWFSGSASGKLKELEESIIKELGFFQQEKKEFKPHIILGRIRKFGWQKLEKTPDISEEFRVLLPIENVAVLESTLVNGKRKFLVVESCPLDY